MPSSTTRPGTCTGARPAGPRLAAQLAVPPVPGRARTARRSRRAARASTARSKSTTFQPVRTSGSSSRTRRSNAREQVALGRARDRARPLPRRRGAPRRRPAPWSAIERTRSRLRVGLDVEREDAQPRRPLGGRDLGVVEARRRARGSLASIARIVKRAADAAVDQVAHGEAHVRLVGRRFRRAAGGRAAAARRPALRLPRGTPAGRSG